MFYVYALQNPETLAIFYIGSTSRIQQRFREHLCSKPPTEKGEIITMLKDKGLRPTLAILLETMDQEEAIRYESEQIDLHIETLCNIATINLIPQNQGTYVKPGTQTLCLRCEHTWAAKVPFSKACPQCRSYQWDTRSIYYVET